MKSRKKVYPVEALADLTADTKITMRKHLNADAMFDAIRHDFTKVTDHRANNRKIPPGRRPDERFRHVFAQRPILTGF